MDIFSQNSTKILISLFLVLAFPNYLIISSLNNINVHASNLKTPRGKPKDDSDTSLSTPISDRDATKESKKPVVSDEQSVVSDVKQVNEKTDNNKSDEQSVGSVLSQATEPTDNKKRKASSKLKEKTDKCKNNTDVRRCKKKSKEKTSDSSLTQSIVQPSIKSNQFTSDSGVTQSNGQSSIKSNQFTSDSGVTQSNGQSSDVIITDKNKTKEASGVMNKDAQRQSASGVTQSNGQSSDVINTDKNKTKEASSVINTDEQRQSYSDQSSILTSLPAEIKSIATSVGSQDINEEEVKDLTTALDLDIKNKDTIVKPPFSSEAVVYSYNKLAPNGNLVSDEDVNPSFSSSSEAAEHSNDTPTSDDSAVSKDTTVKSSTNNDEKDSQVITPVSRLKDTTRNLVHGAGYAAVTWGAIQTIGILAGTAAATVPVFGWIFGAILGGIALLVGSAYI